MKHLFICLASLWVANFCCRPGHADEIVPQAGGGTNQSGNISPQPAGKTPGPIAEIPPPPCPTAKIAVIPMPNGGTVCLWEVWKCQPLSYIGLMTASCAGSICECVGAACTPVDGETLPALQTGGSVQVEDQAIAADNNVTTLEPRSKTMTGNKKIPNFTIPLPGSMVPAAAASDIMPWGQGESKVKYLKTLQLSLSATDTQYYALYKVFKGTDTNPDGMLDADSDRYFGIRVSVMPAEPREVETCDYSATDRVKPFPVSDANVRQEVAVRAPVSLKGAGGREDTPQKWFMLYGLYR